MSKKKDIRDSYKDIGRAPYLDREARVVAADAVGLKYGPSECRPQDADDFLKVFESRHSTVSSTVPVQHVFTRNRGILETLAQ